MNLRTIALILLGVVLGGVAVAVAAYNPAGWAWLEDTKPTPAIAEAVEDQKVYTCGMHPNVTRTAPGNCPICGMKLVAKKPSGPDEEHGSDTDVRVAPGFQQNFAVRTAVVDRGTLPVSIRTVGVLAHNEEKLVSVNTKFEGWIETAHVNNVGESVAEGDILFDIYSPQLVTTQREYLAAMAYVQQLEASDAYPDAIERAKSLLEAARERLHYWDITEEQIDALERSGTAPRTTRFFAPASGFVVEKMGDSLEGMRLQPGMTVLKIADHSTLWAQAEFFESDLRHVREGSEAAIEVDAFPGRRWGGRILFFRSAVDPETRTLTAFVGVDNEDLSLRPMMYVDVSLRVEGASDALLAPAEAVLHSGERAVVIVAKDDGAFEPREVSLGLAAEGMQEITAGLSPGETVVVSSQFLIDSESNLRAATAQMLRGNEEDVPDEPPQHQHHGHH